MLLNVDEVADEQILVKDNLPKAQGAYKYLVSLIGPSSIISLEGEHWQQLRKMFNPAFSPASLETMIPIIVEESETFVTKLTNIADTGNVLRMNNWATYLVIDIMGRLPSS